MGFFILDLKKKKLFTSRKKQVHRNYKTQEILYIFTSTILNKQHKLKMCMMCGTQHTVSGFWHVLITWFLLKSVVTWHSTSTVDFTPNTSNFTWYCILKTKFSLNTVTSDWKPNFQLFFCQLFLKHTVR
jgi:hypothetical protein